MSRWRTARFCVACAFVLGLACQAGDSPDRRAGSEDGAPPSRGRTLETLTDGEKLLLYRDLGIGATEAAARAFVPGLGPMRPEGPGLWDAVTDVEVLARRTKLECNFKNGVLYAVAFGNVVEPSARGDALFDTLAAFYTRHLGAPAIASEGADSPYYVKDRIWAAPGCEVVLTVALDGDRRRVGWGYQEPVHTRPEARSPIP